MPNGVDQRADNLVDTISLVSKKWTPEIVRALDAEGPLGFAQLEYAVPGVSGKMLSQRLDELVEAEVVFRTVVSESPLRVEYTLTDGGRALEPIFAALEQWGARYLVSEAYTVVVADEDPRFTDLIERWFGSAFTVRRAHDREELLDAISDQTTVLLYDTHLPGTSHVDIFRMVREVCPDCRFIAIRTERIGPSVLDLDCDAVIRKPAVKGSIETAISKQLDRHGESPIDREYHALIEKRDAIAANVSKSVLADDAQFGALTVRIEELGEERDAGD